MRPVTKVSDLVRRHAAARPREPAMCCGGLVLSWQELDRRTDALAAALAERLEPGDRVAVLTRNCHRHWEAVLAASKAGSISVPINYRWLPSEVAGAIEDAGARALVLDLSLPHSAHGTDLLASEGLALVVTYGNDVSGASGVARGSGATRTSGAIGGAVVAAAAPPGPAAILDYEAAIAAHAGAAPVERDGGAINVIGFTSGTTGRARGAARTHQASVSLALWFSTLFRIAAGDCFLACMPAYVYRAGAGGLAPMLPGARTVMLDFDAARVLEAIERERVTHVILAPVMVDRLLEHSDLATRDLSSLVTVWVGGAPSSAESIAALQRRVGPIVGSVYGGTEATGIASMMWPPADQRPDLLRSVGRATPLNDIRLVAADGSAAADGEPGEVIVRGESVMAGYWPDVAGGGLADGWYATGDIATRDAEGYLYLVDRRSDVIVSGGINVYSIEVEQVLAQHPAVAQCAVVSGPDEAYGEGVVAIVVPVHGSVLDSAALDAFCRARLAGYKCPRRVEVRDDLPRNAMGKVDKVALRDELWAGRDRPLGGASARV